MLSVCGCNREVVEYRLISRSGLGRGRVGRVDVAWGSLLLKELEELLLLGLVDGLLEEEGAAGGALGAGKSGLADRKLDNGRGVFGQLGAVFLPGLLVALDQLVDALYYLLFLFLLRRRLRRFLSCSGRFYGVLLQRILRPA